MTEPTRDEPERRLFGGMSLPRLAVHVARRGTPLLLAGALIGGGIGLFLGIVQPNSYKSGGMLLVRPGVRESLSPDVTLLGGSGTQAQRSRENVTNAMYVIWNEALFRKIVERVGVEKLMTPADPRAFDNDETSLFTRWLHEAQAWWIKSESESEPVQGDADGAVKGALARMLSKQIYIRPVGGTTLLSVELAASSPERAREITQAALQSAIEVYREAFSKSDATEQVRTELAEVNKQVLEAEAKLREFEEKHGVHDFAAERAQVVTDIADRVKTLDEMTVELEAQRATQELLRTMLKDLPTELGQSAGSTRISNPEYTALVGHVAFLEQKRIETDLDHSLGEKRQADLLVKIDQLLAEKRSKLEQTEPTVELIGEAARLENPRYVGLQTKLDETTVSIRSLERSCEELGKLLRKDRERMSTLEDIAPAHRELENKVQQSRDAATRLAASEVSFENLDRLDRLELSNLLIVQDATFEPDKVGPKRGMLLGAGVVGGLGLAFALAFVAFLTTKRVRDPEDAVLLGAPFHGRLERPRREPTGTTTGAMGAQLGFEDATARLWTQVPLDRSAGRGVSVAFLRDVPGSGMSAAASCYAMGLSLHGQERVVLICGDPQGSWLLQRLRIAPTVGWSDVVAGRAELADALVLVSVGNLAVVSLGESEGFGLASVGSRTLLDKLTKDGCHVVVELPALTEDPASRAALSFVDGCEVVLTKGRSTRPTARAAIEAVRSSGSMLAGVLLEDDARSGPRPDARDAAARTHEERLPPGARGVGAAGADRPTVAAAGGKRKSGDQGPSWRT